MTRAGDFLKSEFGGLDVDSNEYVISLAGDDSLQEDEKYALISEYIAGAIDVSNIEVAVQKLIELALLDLREAKQNANSRELLTEKAVQECLSAIRAPILEVHDSPVLRETDGIDFLRKKELLKLYDPDSDLSGRPSRNAKADDEEEEIYGLGANENKLRKLREREEQRAQAKQEQEDAKQKRVQEKLKKQGEELKGKTVVRSSRRS